MKLLNHKIYDKKLDIKTIPGPIKIYFHKNYYIVPGPGLFVQNPDMITSMVVFKHIFFFKQPEKIFFKQKPDA